MTEDTAHYPVCTACGGEDLEPGFVEDRGEGSQGYTRWRPEPVPRRSW